MNEDTKQSNADNMRTVIVRTVRTSSPTFSVFSVQDTDGSRRVYPVKCWTGPVAPGQRWVLQGEMREDERWGEQFVARFAALAQPTTDRELERFLTSGHLPGWTWRQAVNVLGAHPHPCARLAVEPEWLLSVRGIDQDLHASFLEAWNRGAGLAPIYAQMQAWGIGGSITDKLVKEYQSHTISRLKSDPYRPMFQVKGYGWKTAESIAEKLGIDKRDPRRLYAGVSAAVRFATFQAGHTWLTDEAVEKSSVKLLALPAEEIRHFRDTSPHAPDLVEEDGRTYPEALYRAEQRIADNLSQRLSRPPIIAPERVQALQQPSGLTDAQWAAVLMALSNPVSLLTGGPGVGKTATIKILCQMADELHVPITLMAPTGKAAQRMKEATGRQARTIHSALHITPGSDDFEGTDASSDEEPVRGLVVVDECSMLDTLLCASLLCRISLEAHILFVGDPDQLPSVGPGAVLRDLIQADILCRTHLDKVFRNDAGIAIQAARIRAGESLISLDDCQIRTVQDPDQARALIANLIIFGIAEEGRTLADYLVLTPMNDGPSGRHTLNRELQSILNGEQESLGINIARGAWSIEVRHGDRVIVNINDSQLCVFNGEVGTVTGLDIPSAIEVDLGDRTVTFKGENRRLLDLAYAITGHKSQGSEAPIVLIPVFPSQVLSREWLYTAITRARERCILIGDSRAMQRCLAIQRASERRTTLVCAIGARGWEALIETDAGGAWFFHLDTGILHTRRAGAPWRTSCGFDARGAGWLAVMETSEGRPCLRCLASAGEPLAPFPADLPDPNLLVSNTNLAELGV